MLTVQFDRLVDEGLDLGKGHLRGQIGFPEVADPTGNGIPVQILQGIGRLLHDLHPGYG
jgi:hypothetical protein